MKLYGRILVMGAALAASFLATEAMAAGKPGLWSVTTQMNMPGMPQMPQLTPEQAAQMRQLGIQMPAMAAGGHGMTVQTCITPQQAAATAPPSFTRDNDKCVTQNVQQRGQTMSADMVCTGDMNGTGHVQVTYDSDQHYHGSMDFMGTAQGHPANMTMTMEGNWLKADCAR